MKQEDEKAGQVSFSMTMLFFEDVKQEGDKKAGAGNLLDENADFEHTTSEDEEAGAGKPLDETQGPVAISMNPLDENADFEDFETRG